MSFLSGLKKEIEDRAERRKADQELVKRVKLEAEAHRQKVLEEELKKGAFEVAIAKAKKEAAQKSGVEKLHSENRARNLKKLQKEPSGGTLEKFGEYTRRNMAKTEERKKRTEELRKVLEEERVERMKKVQERRAATGRKW